MSEPTTHDQNEHGLPGSVHDAKTFRTLAAIPFYQRWRSTALPPHIKRWLRHASSDQLKTVAAAALLRLYKHHDQDPTD